jgi:DNA-binding CsgD family transcriptional regulator
MTKAAAALEGGPEQSVCRFAVGTTEVEVLARRTLPKDGREEGQLACFEHAGVHFVLREVPTGPPALDPLCEILTVREREIVRQVASGLRNKQIAYELRLSEYTVAAYIKHICYKLQVRNRTAMVTRCNQLGTTALAELAQRACRGGGDARAGRTGL